MNPDKAATDFRMLFGGVPAVAVTAAAQAVAAALMFATWAVAAWVWSPEEFAAYVVARRAINLLNSVLGCGAFVAVLRYAAGELADRDAAPQRWLLAALTIVVSACVGAWLLQTLGSGLLEPLTSRWGLPTAFIPVLLMATLGVLLQAMVHGYLLSQQRLVEAAVLQVGATALLPLATFVAPGLSPIDNLRLLGIAWCVTAVVPAVWILARAPRRVYRLKTLRDAARETLAFGLPRVPGDFFFLGLLTLPAMFVAARGDLVTASVLGVGVTGMALVVAALRPFALLLVANVSTHAGALERVDVWPRFWRTASAATVIGVVLALAACPLAPALLHAYLGAEYVAASGTLQLMMLSVPTLVVFVVARGVLDALERRPLSAKNAAVACATMTAFSLSGLANGPLIGLLMGLPVLALLSVRDVWRAAHRLNQPHEGSGPLLRGESSPMPLGAPSEKRSDAA